MPRTARPRPAIITASFIMKFPSSPRVGPRRLRKMTTKMVIELKGIHDFIVFHSEFTFPRRRFEPEDDMNVKFINDCAARCRTRHPLDGAQPVDRLHCLHNHVVISVLTDSCHLRDRTDTETAPSRLRRPDESKSFAPPPTRKEI